MIGCMNTTATAHHPRSEHTTARRSAAGFMLLLREFPVKRELHDVLERQWLSSCLQLGCSRVCYDY